MTFINIGGHGSVERIIFFRQINIIFNITIIVAKAALIDRHTQQGFGIIDVDTAAEGFKRQWCRQEHFRCQMKQERFSCGVCRGYCIETTEKKYIVIDWQKGG